MSEQTGEGYRCSAVGIRPGNILRDCLMLAAKTRDLIHILMKYVPAELLIPNSDRLLTLRLLMLVIYDFRFTLYKHS